jgi:hypothetical protein
VVWNVGALLWWVGAGVDRNDGRELLTTMIAGFVAVGQSCVVSAAHQLLSLTVRGILEDHAARNGPR